MALDPRPRNHKKIVLPRKHRKKRLKLADDRGKINTLLETIGDAFFTLDKKMIVTYVNQAAEILLGRERDEVIGRPFFEIFSEAQGSIFEHNYQYAIKHKVPLHFEVFFAEAPFTNWYDVRIYPQTAGVSVFFQVVTERKNMEPTNRGSESMLASLLESLNDALISYDLITHLPIHINSAAAALYGRPLEELVQSPDFWMSQVHPLDKNKIAKTNESLLVSGLTVVEYRILRPDGSIRWVLHQNKLIRDVLGDSSRVDSLIIDISDRIEAEKALAQAQELQERILDTVSEGIIMVDTSGRIVYVNQGAEHILCLDRDQILNTFFHERVWQLFDEFMQPVPEGHSPLALALNRKKMVTAIDQGLIDPDGDFKWLSVNAYPLFDKTCEVTGAIASFRDITLQKLAEQKIRFQANLLDTVGQAAIAFNLHNQILFANHFTEILYGWKTDELIGKLSFETIIPVESQDKAALILESVLKGETWSGEITHQRNNGETFIAYCTATPIQENERITGYLGISIDITERKRAEEREHQLRILSDALRDTAAALTSTLNFKEVFERILTNVGKVIAHDSANLMLIDGEEVYVVLSKGYQDQESKSLIDNLRFPKNLYPSIGWMIEHKRPLVISQTSNSPLWNPEPGLRWVKSYAGLPLLHRDTVIGFLNLDSQHPGYFSEEDALRLQSFADQAVLAVENARLYEEVQQLSITGPLTGIYNRRGLYQFCNERIQEAWRSNTRLAVWIADIDHFKQINDSYGHLVGDQVLIAVSRRIKNRLRPNDIIGRFGGDEFVILLMDVDQDGAQIIADRIQKSISGEPVQTLNQSVELSISVGLYAPNQVDIDFPTLLQNADQALYLAKAARGNPKK